MFNIVAKGPFKNQAGSILFVVAAGIVVFIGIAGLAIDLGMLYNVRTDLQNAMDAAAMAGASQLDGKASGIDRAVAQALAATNNYYFNTTPVDVTPADVTFSANRDSGYVDQGSAAGSPAGIRFVKVAKQKTMDLALLKIVPGVGSTTNVSAVAVAGQSPPINEVCDGLVPIAPEPVSYVIGSLYTLHFPGGYSILNLIPMIGGGGGRGGGLGGIGDLLSVGAQGCIGIGDGPFLPIPSVPNPLADVVAGLASRFNSDTDTLAGPYSTYSGNGRRILPVPIVSCSPTSLCAITGPSFIYDLVCFFMNSPVNPVTGDITGEFIGQCNSNGKLDPGKGSPGLSGLPGQRRIVLYR